MLIPIAVPIKPQIVSEGIRLTQKVAEQGGDYCELWCDQLKLEDAIAIINASDLPVIVTLKDETEHGQFTGTVSEKLNYFHQLSQLEQVSYIDVKYNLLDDAFVSAIKKPIIASYHDFERTKPLPELLDVVDKMAEAKPAIIKLATTIQYEIDLINLFQLQLRTANWRKRRVIIGMGDKGVATRVMSPLFEHALTFAALDSTTTTAPGQLTVGDLRREWETLRFNTPQA